MSGQPGGLALRSINHFSNLAIVICLDFILSLSVSAGTS